jgi:hypothetical protein
MIVLFRMALGGAVAGLLMGPVGIIGGAAGGLIYAIIAGETR